MCILNDYTLMGCDKKVTTIEMKKNIKFAKFYAFFAFFACDIFWEMLYISSTRLTVQMQYTAVVMDAAVGRSKL